MHAVIRHYHFAPKDSKEIDQKIADEFLPMHEHLVNLMKQKPDIIEGPVVVHD